MRSLLTVTTLISAANAAGACGWDYGQNGADWPTANLHDCGDESATQTNYCGGGHQSPVDLKTSWVKKSAGFDNFNKLYTNQKTDIPVQWLGITSQVAVNKAGQDLQTFESSHAAKSYGGPDRFTGVQFHFHTKSEHTVDGKYYDLEMHTVHAAPAAKNGMQYAAMGIMFDVNSPTRAMEPWEDKIIEDFFESLEWTKKEDPSDPNSKFATPKVAEVPYGNLMMMVDTQNRYTYRGSVTTPPCIETVYWNVVRTVYPLKQKYLDQFKAQFTRADGDLKRSEGMVQNGNYRVIQPETFEHQPFIITNGADLTKPTRAQNVPKPAASGAAGSTGSININLTQTPAGKSTGTDMTSETDSSSQYLLVVTILLIIAIVFLLFSVVVVVKNSFENKRSYNDVQEVAQNTDRQKEGGEAEMM